MLELYNMTNDVKRIPKFNYDGKFVIKPHEAVDIQDDQAFFFKPYAKVGIVVRCKKDPEPRKPETVTIRTGNAVQGGFIDVGLGGGVEKETLSSPTYEETEPVKEVEVVETPAEVVTEPVVEESTPAETETVEAPVLPVYTEEQLSEMNREQLREAAKTLGLDASTMGRKQDIKDLILFKQNETK